MPVDTETGPALARTLVAQLREAEDSLSSLDIVDIRDDPTPRADGTSYCTLRDQVGDVAVVHVHPERLRLAFGADPSVAATAGERAGLRVRPKAVQPPQTLVFVESRAEIAAAVNVLTAVCASRARD